MTNFSDFYLRSDKSTRDGSLKLTIEKLVEGKWIRTALAPDLDAVAKHARAVGGRVQALTRDGDFVAEWVDGIRQSDSKQLTADEIKESMRAAAPGAQRLLHDMKGDQLRGAEAAAKGRYR